MFAALDPRTTAVDASERAIRAAILDGRLAPGDRLPPERQLATTFGINRLTLRAALARLAAAGLVSVRQGSGYLVRDWREGGPDLIAGLVELASGKAAQRMVADLLEVRRHLARAVLERLVQVEPRGHHLERFHAAVKKMGRLADARASSEELAEADLAILAALVDATGSPVFRLCGNPVAQVLARLPALRAAVYAEPHANVAGWHAVGTWLATRRPEAVERMLALLAGLDAQTAQRFAAARPRSPR